MMRSGCVLTLIVALVSCGKGGDQYSKPVSALPESLWLATAPSDAQSILAVAKTAQDGDTVTITGRVGGDRDVFLEGRALFRIVDASLQDCTKTGDGCKTPWDYCCEDVSTKAAASATVEIHDGSGVLKSTARGFHGLDHGKTVTVRGRVRKDAQGNLAIVASGLHVM